MRRRAEIIIMRYVITFLVTLVSVVSAVSQVTRVSTPQHLAIDRKDNLFVGLQYGIIKITPDGTITNLTKQAVTTYAK